MLPTLEVVGDWVLVSKTYRRGRGVAVGDLVSFDSVVEPGQQVIKRVLGLQGDYVLRDTPGTNDKMIQVCGLVLLLRERTDITRFLRGIAGLWGTICRIRGTRGILVRCLWR